jgi:hypothetical protein
MSRITKLLEDFGFQHDSAVTDVHMMRLSRERYFKLHALKGE